MEEPYSMLGYYDEGKAFAQADVNKDTAREAAVDRDLKSYLLAPQRSPFEHGTRVRVEKGKYKVVPTRIFVFGNLLNPEIKRIPNKEEVAAGRHLELGE